MCTGIEQWMLDGRDGFLVAEMGDYRQAMKKIIMILCQWIAIGDISMNKCLA